MEQMTFEQGVETIMESILGDRLTILAGAGLSMSAPSNLPSASAIAASASAKYAALYGADRPPLPAGIEEQAELFFQRGELFSIYFQRLIDRNIFAAPPNPGHHALADLLLVRAIQTAITTNVDALIESAGRDLFGEIGVGIDGHTAAEVHADQAPLLKIHGCHVRDPRNMVWARGQLEAHPVAGRIASSAQWLEGRLLNRDLLIVGYSTDWAYLNAILQSTLGHVTPCRVIVVNLAESAVFVERAAELYALGERATVRFGYVTASAADFLAAVRERFSKTFIRGVLHSGISEYTARAGAAPQAAWTEPVSTDNQTLWQIRRDLEGCVPTQPASLKAPPPGNLVGLTLIQLRAAGATPDGQFWALNEQRIRLIRANDKYLHRVQAEFERELAPTVAPDIVIAVGAESQQLPANIAREGTTATIARGTKGRWFTRQEAEQELHL